MITKQGVAYALVGLLSIAGLSMTLITLQNSIDEEQLIKPEYVLTRLDIDASNSVLGVNSSKTATSAKVVSITDDIGSSTSEIVIEFSLYNYSQNITQLSPPIDIWLTDAFNGGYFPVVASNKTTLLGGSVQPGEVIKGMLVFVIETNDTSLGLYQLHYQPSYSSETVILPL